MKITHSPNQNERKTDRGPFMLVLHYTGTLSAEEADRIYMTSGKVAPHYMIDKDGLITKYVEEEKRAWHAGQSSWNGITDINSASIGIEIVNSGHHHDLEKFPDGQVTKLIELVEDIRSRWNIPDYYILGHSDISPGRKIDPGEKFPWRKLQQAGIGFLPQAPSVQDNATPDLLANLREFGYDYTDDIEILRREFRRHYLAESFHENIDDKILYSAATSLLQQKKLTFLS